MKGANAGRSGHMAQSAEASGSRRQDPVWKWLCSLSSQPFFTMSWTPSSWCGDSTLGLVATWGDRERKDAAVGYAHTHSISLLSTQACLVECGGGILLAGFKISHNSTDNLLLFGPTIERVIIKVYIPERIPDAEL